MLISTALDHYTADALKRIRSKATHVNNCKHLSAGFAGRNIEDLFDSSIVHDYVQSRYDGEVAWLDDNGVPRGGREAKAGAVRRELGVMAAAFEFVYQRQLYDGKIPKIPRPPAPPPRSRWLLREEALRIINHLKPRPPERMSRAFRAFLLFIFTGARKGAVEGLTWDRVTIVYGGKSNGFIDYRDPSIPVTKKRRAVVPITDELLPYLEQMKREAQTPFVLDHSGNIRYALETACVEKLEVPDFSIHCLRKTFATWAAQDGVPIKLIADALGDTVATTEKDYAMYHPDYMRALVKRNVFDGVEPASPMQRPDDPRFGTVRERREAKRLRRSLAKD